MPIISAPLLTSISCTADSLYKKAVEKVLEEAKAVWDREKQEIIEKLTRDRDNKKSDIVQHQMIVDSLATKIEENKVVAELSQQIIEEESRLKVFHDKEKVLLSLQIEFDKVLDELANAQDLYLQIHKEYSNYVNIREDVSVDDLEFEVINPFSSKIYFHLYSFYLPRYEKLC